MAHNGLRLPHTTLLLAAGLLLAQSAPVHGSLPTDESVHFSVPFDYEQWRRDHPRPAAKRLADLNVGEPRTVRMIYFLPNDWDYRPDVVESMKALIRRVQTFYGEQMEAHGYGERTFRIETDAEGEPLVHRVDGQHPFSHYDNTLGGAVLNELGQSFDLDGNTYFIVLGTDAIRQSSGVPVGGVGASGGKASGYAMCASACSFGVAAHELGHAFGLVHDFRDRRFIMSYGVRRTTLSACAAEQLSVHPYFNPAISIEGGPPPVIEFLSPAEYPGGSSSAPIRLRVTDSEGILQVVMGAYGQEACRSLAGAKEAVVEFEYDGSHGQDQLFTRLGESSSHRISAIAIDVHGNRRITETLLTEVSPYRLATLGQTGVVKAVAFSPDGSTLAAAGGNFIRLLDVESRREVASLGGGARSIAFSPDGSTLAAAGGNFIRLLDVESRREVPPLGGSARSIAFSPDGSILAWAASRDPAVELWDMVTRRKAATLEGHASEVRSVAFSPDGTTVASASHDGTVKLWDVATRTEVATLEGNTGWGFFSVAFSPDGAILASGESDGILTLWDVATRTEAATLEGHTSEVRSVAFSPDGAILASGAVDHTVRLWDVASTEALAVLPGHTDQVWSVAFSPHGAILASASLDRRVNLWDVSEWAGPRAFALEIISGDGQQGAPGTSLTRPLVVEVRDQYGDSLPGAAVTFTVAAGDGRLSGRFTVEHATADADGRAELTLDLGPLPGPNIVGVSLGGYELAAITAQGVGTSVAELEGDYRTWHLPAEATARLGKGALGAGDRAVALSADGRCLAVASAIGVWLYEAATSRAQALLPTEVPVHSVAFSMRGTLAAGLHGGRVELWDVETGERAGELRHSAWSRVTSVVFSPDGTTPCDRVI